MQKQTNNFLAFSLILSLTTSCSESTLAPSTPAPPTPIYTLRPQPVPYIRQEPFEYHLYLPQAYTPDREWPLFVGLHGAGGTAYECLAAWQPYADQAGFVLMCPTLQDGYRGWDHDEKKVVLHETITRLRKEIRLQARVFVAGFSRGGRLAQRFAWAYPEDTAGAAILAAVEYDLPAEAAKAVPFLVVLGDKDHLGGVEQVQDFAGTLRQTGFTVELHILPGVVHELTDEMRELTLNFFRQTFGNS